MHIATDQEISYTTICAHNCLVAQALLLFCPSVKIIFRFSVPFTLGIFSMLGNLNLQFFLQTFQFPEHLGGGIFHQIFFEVQIVLCTNLKK